MHGKRVFYKDILFQYSGSRAEKSILWRQDEIKKFDHEKAPKRTTFYVNIPIAPKICGLSMKIPSISGKTNAHVKAYYFQLYLPNSLILLDIEPPPPPPKSILENTTEKADKIKENLLLLSGNPEKIIKEIEEHQDTTKEELKKSAKNLGNITIGNIQQLVVNNTYHYILPQSNATGDLASFMMQKTDFHPRATAPSFSPARIYQKGENQAMKHNSEYTLDSKERLIQLIGYELLPKIDTPESLFMTFLEKITPSIYPTPGRSRNITEIWSFFAPSCGQGIELYRIFHKHRPMLGAYSPTLSGLHIQTILKDMEISYSELEPPHLRVPLINKILMLSKDCEKLNSICLEELTPNSW